MAWLAVYHFDDLASATVVDATGNGYDIDLTGSAGAQVVGGQTGGALGKTGAAMPQLPAGLRTAMETDDRGLMLDVLGVARTVWWFRLMATVLGSGIWGALSLDDATLISRARRQSDSAAAGALTIGTLSAVTWHNACITYKRSTGVLSVYWDGALVTSGVPAGWAPGTQLMTGADVGDLTEWSDLGPAVDNLRIATHCPDDAEVAALAGTPVTADAPPVEQGSAEVPLTVGLSVAATVPPATVAQGTTTLPVSIGVTTAGVAPPVPIQSAGLALPLSVALAPAGLVPVASVPAATTTIPLTLTTSAGEAPAPATAPAALGGWESLLDTMRWNATAAAHERENDPVACPQHGDPLDQHNGKLHCPMGHFVSRH